MMCKKDIFALVLLLNIIVIFNHLNLWSQTENHKFPKPAIKKRFLDEVLIKSTICHFQQSIKNQDIPMLKRLISEKNNTRTNLNEDKFNLEQFFLTLEKKRRIVILSKKAELNVQNLKKMKSTWDFEVEIILLRQM